MSRWSLKQSRAPNANKQMYVSSIQNCINAYLPRQAHRVLSGRPGQRRSQDRRQMKRRSKDRQKRLKADENTQSQQKSFFLPPGRSAGLTVSPVAQLQVMSWIIRGSRVSILPATNPLDIADVTAVAAPVPVSALVPWAFLGAFLARRPFDGSRAGCGMTCCEMRLRGKVVGLMVPNAVAERREVVAIDMARSPQCHTGGGLDGGASRA